MTSVEGVEYWIEKAVDNAIQDAIDAAIDSIEGVDIPEGEDAEYDLTINGKPYSVHYEVKVKPHG